MGAAQPRTARIRPARFSNKSDFCNDNQMFLLEKWGLLVVFWQFVHSTRARTGEELRIDSESTHCEGYATPLIIQTDQKGASS